ncbi:NUDIX hydrolase [Bradyrhizobium sp. U87765 SZCCT0131]|uniref:NUDIX hydrolase n=1 Tax=unclassified Bradyrhizobium TaxID=2631580 RepID=UPI001BAE1B56|nr:MULTISPECIES: NUDIX hydrolase [unclassified Bradyrhizobium]MBR1223156.1 NUDIX hydrolase [Bradyrhizobium sp. U87765 SZCCT0131]MBR1265734.1 NUDIX hydrolase [Bradyrhizobium sp. U87765 SZCCT0134]MBR1309295.1 NUDIX hydrolase [Bradyrhizobium sp. U87765 SZCCT0110]MBR1324123.1 NUDIX hydrolase [Bradyrhizobium sp. U87765 SZCCT0109]MBR1352556.1 NUDIX hydrolase [Bradyrhizobium sp. U87765 SZCCT0048]
MTADKPLDDAAAAKAGVSPARLASTMLLLREGAAGMEIFMVVRHHEIDFASGALVFPGGSVEPGDRDIAGRPELWSGGDGIDPDLLALRIGGVRETFEECGVLLARPKGSQALIGAERLRVLDAARGDIEAGKLSFADLVAGENLVLALDLLVPFAHWITPTRMPKRFDTHFFLAVAPADQVAVHDGKEAVDSVWIGPRQSLDEAKSGRFKILFPTERNLIKLARSQTAAEALARARSEPVVTVMPEMTKGEGGQRQLRIPKDAGYDGEVFDVSFG